MKPVNFTLVNLIFTISLFVFCPYVKGLQCYVTVDFENTEKVFQCEEMLLLPTVHQMNQIVNNNPNPTPPIHKKGKLACRKLGLMKSCGFVSAERKMGCSGKIKMVDLDKALHSLAMQSQSSASLPMQDCLCDTDRCNDGDTLTKKTSNIFSVTSAMITLLLGNRIF